MSLIVVEHSRCPRARRPQEKVSNCPRRAIGSSIVDATFLIGISPLLFPITVFGYLAETTGLYALFASFLVIVTLALRQLVILVIPYPYKRGSALMYPIMFFLVAN